MKLKSLRLKNIRSYEDEEIVFPDGSTLLSGDIGSGKTSILLAIEYVFFGLQPGQRGSSLLSNGKDVGEVALKFEIDGRKVLIERGLKRGSKTVSQDYAAITIDEQKIESSVTELKTKILELLNYPQEFIKKTNLLYRYTVYTPQEEMKQIILEEPESRINILRHIFGIDKYKKIGENLLIISSKLREKSRFLQIEIRNLDENIRKLDSYKELIRLLDIEITAKNSLLKERENKRTDIELEISGIEGKIREKEKLEKEIEKTGIMIKSKEEHLIRLGNEAQDLENKIAEIKYLFNEEEYSNLLEEIKGANSHIGNISRDHIDLSGKIKSLKIKKDEDSAKKDRIFKIDICPTCLQDVTENHKHNILNETERQIAIINTETKNLTLELEQISFLLDKERAKLEELKNKKSELDILKIKTEEVRLSKEKISSYKKLKENLEADIHLLSDQIKILAGAIFNLSKFDNIYKIKQETLKQAVQDEKKVEIELAELKKEHQLTKREIESLEKKIEELKGIQKKVHNLIEVEKWLSDDFSELIKFIEKSIMVKLRDEFSKLFNHWFTMLTTDEFYARLDENFTPIITQKDFEIDYSFLSGGERTAVALAYRLALNQTINSILSRIKTRDLVILDEPTDGFSEQQLDKVREILHELKVGQLILVSHEQKIEGFVDNIIRLKKAGGVSRKE